MGSKFNVFADGKLTWTYMYYVHDRATHAGGRTINKSRKLFYATLVPDGRTPEQFLYRKGATLDHPIILFPTTHSSLSVRLPSLVIVHASAHT